MDHEIYYDLIKEISGKIFDQLGTSFSENVYVKAMDAYLKSRNHSTYLESPVPIMLDVDGMDVFVGTARADLAVLCEDGTRLLIEVKHCKATATAINEAREQVCNYNTLMRKQGANNTYLFVVIFGKDHPPYIQMLDDQDKVIKTEI